MQYLRGYCVLQSDPVVESINALDPSIRGQFLEDMVLVGDAILEVTGAYRMNYFIGGNSDPVLHAHIVPRYLTEPEELRRGGPWSHPEANDEATFFDHERDQKLMKELGRVILSRYTATGA
jgi:diadenosine tetraphosphate (Ap4A) HIT family hydrolase